MRHVESWTSQSVTSRATDARWVAFSGPRLSRLIRGNGWTTKRGGAQGALSSFGALTARRAGMATKVGHSFSALCVDVRPASR